MATVLVTGGTGLIGSNVCSRLRQQGDRVRALVRPGSRTAELGALGVELAEGDVTSAEDVIRAAEGCEYCIHLAALVPGGGQYPVSAYHALNVTGTRNVLDAARRHSLERTVTVSSSAAFNAGGCASETMPLRTADERVEPYALTKALAHEEVIAAVADGLNVVTVLPGATIGPAPTLGRAVEPPGFNSRIILALRGAFTEFPPVPLSFVLASDVAGAAISALGNGRAGEVYLAWGRPEDVTDTVTMFNRACELAGVDHRIRALTADELRSDEIRARWGTAIARTAETAIERGADAGRFTNARTAERLRYRPASYDNVIATTVEWMLKHGLTA
jgi:dihydroflavonol-4-reductase